MSGMSTIATGPVSGRAGGSTANFITIYKYCINNNIKIYTIYIFNIQHIHL